MTPDYLHRTTAARSRSSGSWRRRAVARFSSLLLAALALTLLMISSASAAETVPFDQGQFATAQKEGRPILIDISASWCPTCAAQRPIIERLSAKPEFGSLIIFKVDFDAQKDVVRQFHARQQSTLIAFRGTLEATRSVGDTDESSIERLLRSTLN